MAEQLIDTRFRGQLVPVGSVVTPILWPPPAHRLRHRHRAATTDTHRRRRRDRPVARTLRRAPAPQAVFPSTPDGESTPALDLPAVPPAHRLENHGPRRRPLTATTRAPACQGCSYDLMIDPWPRAAKRPPADPRRPPPGRSLFRSTRPPLLTTPPGGASDSRRTTISAPVCRHPEPATSSTTRCNHYGRATSCGQSTSAPSRPIPSPPTQ